MKLKVQNKRPKTELELCFTWANDQGGRSEMFACFFHTPLHTTWATSSSPFQTRRHQD